MPIFSQEQDSLIIHTIGITNMIVATFSPEVIVEYTVITTIPCVCVRAYVYNHAQISS